MSTAQTYMDSLKLDESLGILEKLLTEIGTEDEAEEAAKQDIALQREQLARRDAELLMDVVGKNETERKAMLRTAQDKDAEYQDIARNLHNRESDLSGVQVSSADLRRRWQYHRIKLEVNMAKLAFLGGGRSVEAITNNHGSELYG